jgi:hypothetical protein
MNEKDDAPIELCIEVLNRLDKAGVLDGLDDGAVEAGARNK